MQNTIRKLYSLVFVKDEVNKKILLGYKKRGFGMHKWNGLGGKIEPNETHIEGAKREVKEESDLDIDNPHQMGYLEFQFENKLEETLECHVFVAKDFKGQIRECDEMRPQWFDEDQIPFDQMWQDDKYWLPHFIKNKYVNAYFLFKEDQETIVSQSIQLFDTQEAWHISLNK